MGESGTALRDVNGFSYVVCGDEYVDVYDAGDSHVARVSRVDERYRLDLCLDDVFREELVGRFDGLDHDSFGRDVVEGREEDLEVEIASICASGTPTQISFRMSDEAESARIFGESREPVLDWSKAMMEGYGDVEVEKEGSFTPDRESVDSRPDTGEVLEEALDSAFGYLEQRT